MRLFLGVDMGGTRIKAGLLTEDGELLEKKNIPTKAERGKETALSNLTSLIESFSSNRNITAIGLSIASPLDPWNGILYNPPNLPGFDVFDLKSYLKDRISIPFVIDNDANCYALGEWWKGAGRGARVLLCITLGTGIGGGLVVNGNIWHGAHGLGGEFGHITINIDGPSCNCGNRGCFEAMGSSKYLMECYKKLSGKEATPDKIYKLALEGNEAALESFRLLGRNIAVGLASLCNALDPDVAVIGGGLSNAGMLLLDCVKVHFEPLLLSGLRGKVKLRLAELKDYAGVYGAAYLAIKSLKGGEA